MFCKQCGRELADSANFCPRCGWAVPSKKAISPQNMAGGNTYPNMSGGNAYPNMPGGSTRQEAPGGIVQQKPPKRGILKIVLLIAGILFIGAAAVFTVFFAKRIFDMDNDLKNMKEVTVKEASGNDKEAGLPESEVKKETNLSESTEKKADVPEGTGKNADAAAEAEKKAAEVPIGAENFGPQGSVLNIATWNEEFKSRITDHYPGYIEIDGTTGKIGDVVVNWLITPYDDNAYQKRLDELLLQDKHNADERIDLFLVEADYAVKYADTDYTLALDEIGITDYDTRNQYQYTKTVVSDSRGQVKGVSWQCCPGVMIYNRSIAKKVFGTDDPNSIQTHFSDWDKFYTSAGQLGAAGYDVVSSTQDTFRVYCSNIKSPWVGSNNKINVDESVIRWAEDSKKLADAGYCHTWGQWGEEWNRGFYPEGKVFAYFGPAWFIDYCMGAGVAESIANDGGWGAIEGPQGYFWGGTWICVATETDNQALAADIIRKMTCDPDIMRNIVLRDNDFVNNRQVMEELANDPYCSNSILGGQNPLKAFCYNADRINMAPYTAYDQGLLGSYQSAMEDYVNGNTSFNDAMNNFYDYAKYYYPELQR